MEIPHDLSVLYRHWEQHTIGDAESAQLTGVISDATLAVAIDAFVKERMAIWMKKQRGDQLPYTDDPILQKFRFCNILRELDRQTIEYHTLLNPLRGDFALWLLNMFYARMVARPDTVRVVGLLSYDEQENEKLYERLSTSQKPRYGTPYVFPISTIMRSQTPTRELFITKHLPSVMKNIADEIATWQNEPVMSGVEKIIPLFGYNLQFLWTEVLIDVAYQYPERIDLFGQFPIGPGAAPTFARINPSADPSQLACELGALHIPSGLTYHGAPVALSSENWEGIGCEFRKYSNLSAGRGRKRYYKGITS